MVLQSSVHFLLYTSTPVSPHTHTHTVKSEVSVASVQGVDFPCAPEVTVNLQLHVQARLVRRQAEAPPTCELIFLNM